MTEAVISVAMPVYNAARYLAEAVRSIQDQTFTRWELIAVDDGSTDGSPAVLQELALRDPRIRPIARPHAGLAVALNHAIGLAHGSLIARMDGDDVALPHRFARQLEFMEAHPEVLAIGTRILQIAPDGTEVCEAYDLTDHESIDAFHLSQRGSAIAHPTAMMRRAAVLEVGGYRQELDPADDLDLWLRLAECGRLANLSEVLLRYRLHDASLTQRRRQAMCDMTSRAVSHACERRGLAVPSPRRFEPLAFPFRPVGHTLWVRMAWRAGRYRSALKLAWSAIRRTPLAPDAWQVLFEAISAPVVGPVLNRLGL